MQSEVTFFVDIERLPGGFGEHFRFGKYEWTLLENEVRHGPGGNRIEAGRAYEPNIDTRGRSATLWGARFAARRRKRLILKARNSDKRYLPREVV